MKRTNLGGYSSKVFETDKEVTVDSASASQTFKEIKKVNESCQVCS